MANGILTPVAELNGPLEPPMTAISDVTVTGGGPVTSLVRRRRRRAAGMPLSMYALDNFVAQDLSQLTECRAAPVASEFPDCASWLSSFVLNWIFRIPLTKEKAALAFALIRRAEGAVADYEEAREHLAKLVAGNRSISISLYFRCLRRFESTVGMLYQSLDFVRKALGIQLFAEGDGSPYERLNLLYNKGRHSNPESLPAGQLHAVWIRNDGLHTDGANLTFDELRDLILDIGRIADKLAKGEVPAEPAHAREAAAASGVDSESHVPPA